MKQGEVTEANCRERNVICMIIVLLKDLIKQKNSFIYLSTKKVQASSQAERRGIRESRGGGKTKKS